MRCKAYPLVVHVRDQLFILLHYSLISPNRDKRTEGERVKNGGEWNQREGERG